MTWVVEVPVTPFRMNDPPPTTSVDWGLKTVLVAVRSACRKPPLTVVAPE
jgi:hypothetical protein